MKNKVYLISIIFGTIALFLIVFLIYPALNDIQNSSDKISEDRDLAALITAEAKELDNFNKNYSDYEINLKKIDQLFVDAKDPIDFIKFLENTASVSGIDTNINLNNSSQNKTNGAVPTAIFQIQAHGDFLNMLKFCSRLEAGQYLIKIQNLSVRNSAKEIVNGKTVSKGVDADFIIEAVAK